MTVLLALVMGAGVSIIVSARLWPQSSERRDRRLSKVADFEADLRRAGFERVPIGVFAGAAFALGLALGAVALALTGVVAVALIALVGGSAAPVTIVRVRSVQRRNRNRLVWPDVVDHLVASIRSGVALPEGVAGLAESGPVVLREDFAAYTRQYRLTGSFRVALDELKERLADPTADRILETLRMSRDVGGSELPTVLKSLGSYLREEQAVRHEVEAKQSWVMNAAKLGSAAPWIVLLMLGTRPEAASAFNSLEGAIVILIGLGVTVAAYLLMLRIAKLKDDRRWFA
ncbi:MULTISPECIES: type II secretion system F family protein [unclassified Pseudoclavibacter]|uniref:type II secretion system F family protein n=1 Tax=unclassified Pseudoclavibacter TaxID=2615177 RepID=UPI000CE91D26|nr:MULTISPECIES: type II secretion system F family protein [unclassified Pseudoclavibacter]MBF4549709.1 type II secretion system F family protein [Pseudoclavibacter sp. VKM Ac-2888]PPG03029.1 type II secretion system protein F [Pseudoclavibacter sp. RFBI5]